MCGEGVRVCVCVCLRACVFVTTAARAVGEVSGRQRALSGARGIGGPEVTSPIPFWEGGIPGNGFQACPYLPGSTIICLT